MEEKTSAANGDEEDIWSYLSSTVSSYHQHTARLDDDDKPTSPPKTKIFDRFFVDSSSEDEPDEFSRPSVAGKKLDYMIQFLDRKLSSSPISGPDAADDDRRRSLPEFVGSGGGTGYFKVPVRAAVHPHRPPSLEFVPHPLRETQIGCFVRTLVSSSEAQQLWIGTESGVRVLNLANLYSCDDSVPPCNESVETMATLCMVADAGNRLVWSGHKDGKIRSWKMDLDGTRFKECLSWLAHRGPVLSMVITSYGDLWSCTENGTIKMWPWEAIEKSLSLTIEERHITALSVERSYIDLRSQAAVNSFSNMLPSDVKYLLSDNATAKVWSAGYLSFALWDARTRELLKVFNIDGQIENGLDLLSVQDFTMEDEVKMRLSGGPKKEKLQTSIGFFQRSRNAIIGAADAVRRVAAKGAFGDDNRRTEALIRTVNGMIWTGCTSGLLIEWDSNGNQKQEVQYHSFSVQCFCTFGSRIWIGYISGTVQVLDLSGHLIGEWVAHSSPVIKMAVGTGYIFTLASHGGIRGWNVASPCPLDGLLSSELAGKEFLYTRLENVKILAGTWNVAQGKVSHDSLISWLSSSISDVGIVVVGLQEVEMGAGVLAISAAKETVGLEGSSLGQWWLDMIGKTLDEGLSFERVGSRQLAGLLIAVWVRNDLRAHVGDVDAGAVPCGFGRAIGNKGAVGLRMRVYDRIMCFVNCHFAAHLEAVNRRNADFDHVYRTMTFSRPSNLVNSAPAGVSSAVQMFRSNNASGSNSVDGMPELSEADMVVFLGDFNYRLYGISYDEARDFVSQRCFDWLRERDQLRSEMEAGNVFQGMREAVIRFPPTYKFERHQAGLAGYDSGEKKRIPAWCDRIVYRDSRSPLASSECSLECPVVSSISQYEACMDVTDSDHKPVRCILDVDIARVDESVRRQEYGEIIRSNKKIRGLLEELGKVPETIVSTNNIILQNQDTSILRISNKCTRGDALFEIICEGQSTIQEDGQASNHQPRGSFGFPRWLQVSPASGIVKPDEITEVSLHHEEYHTFEEFVDGVPQNWWCEDARDKEVILVVKVHGMCTTEPRNHRIRVRRSLSSKTIHDDSKLIIPKEMQGNVLRRSNFENLGSSYDFVDHLKNLHTP